MTQRRTISYVHLINRKRNSCKLHLTWKGVRPLWFGHIVIIYSHSRLKIFMTYKPINHTSRPFGCWLSPSPIWTFLSNAHQNALSQDAQVPSKYHFSHISIFFYLGWLEAHLSISALAFFIWFYTPIYVYIRYSESRSAAPTQSSVYTIVKNGTSNGPKNDLWSPDPRPGQTFDQPDASPQ